MPDRRNIFLIAVLTSLIAVSCDRNPPPAEKAYAPVEPGPMKVLASPFAGSWYSADKTLLSEEIDGYFKQAAVEPLADLNALILPHAGYRYSGPIAGSGAAQLKGRNFSRVIVIGPNHHAGRTNQAVLPAYTHYSTPLGEIEIDREFVNGLRKFPQFVTSERTETAEHSVQMELPLLQKALGSFKLVPIIVGELDLPMVKATADAIRSLIDERTLVVASSDFTHFGNDYRFKPFDKDIPASLKKLDMGAVERIEAKDLAGFDRYVEKTGATICGRYAIAVLLAMLPPGSKAHLLKYDTSGRMAGQYDPSVSYVSLAFTGKWRRKEIAGNSQAEPALSKEDQRRILKLARQTLTYYFEKGKEPTLTDLGIRPSEGMKRIMGAFVTLKENGELRGCIGEILATRPLHEAVLAQALNSALRDPRFPPVTKSESAKLEIEISALFPPHPVGSYREIVLGKHGVILEKSGRSAVFLPQVALEQKWNLEETLTNLSMKAGLRSDDWKEGAGLSVFEAIVFSEHGV